MKNLSAEVHVVFTLLLDRQGLGGFTLSVMKLSVAHSAWHTDTDHSGTVHSTLSGNGNR